MNWNLNQSCLLAGVFALMAGCHSDFSFAQPVDVCAPPPSSALAETEMEATTSSELPGGILPASYRHRPAVPVSPETDHQPVTRVEHRTCQPVAPSTRPGRKAKPPRPSGFARAFDYRWLVGRLHYDARRDRWSVCYAEKGSSDRYGGVLEIVGAGPMTGFHAGQFVRVEGELIDPAPLEIKPAYRVRALQRVVQ